MIDQTHLIAFLTESNQIERIFHVRPDEIEAAEVFLRLPAISIYDIEKYVAVTAPRAQLRQTLGLDVAVGNYVAPAGGPELMTALANLLAAINERRLDPYTSHIEYECIHPFTDGNGPSGRLIWLWQMKRDGMERLPALGFLQSWYYQSLAAAPTLVMRQ